MFRSGNYSGYGIFISLKHFSKTRKSHQVDLIERYRNSISCPQSFSARASEELGLAGFTGPLIPLLMSESKYLILASKQEGEPRIVNEAIKSGCIVLYTSELKFSKPEIMQADNLKEFQNPDILIIFPYLEAICKKTGKK